LNKSRDKKTSAGPSVNNSWRFQGGIDLYAHISDDVHAVDSGTAQSTGNADKNFGSRHIVIKKDTKTDILLLFVYLDK
jgi:hypothetical protein